MAGHTILVAQGEQQLAASLAQTLVRAGHSVPPPVTVAGDLESAVERHSPDLLLLDADFPCTWEPASASFPTVYLSASPDHAGPLVLKPVHDRELVAVIDLALERASFQRRIQIDEHAELAAVYQESPVMLCVLDSDRRFVYANDAFTRMAARTDEELRSRSLCTVIGCGAAAKPLLCKICEALADTFSSGIAHHDITVEAEFAPSGALRQALLLASTARISVPSGPNRLLLCLTDITLQEMSRKALVRSEETYRTLIESAGQALLVAQDGLLKFANSTAERFIGRSRQELANTPFAELIHPADRAFVHERHLARLAGKAQVGSYQFRVIDGSGRISWVEVNGISIEWEGKPATLNLLRDVSARIDSEADYTTLFQSMLDGFAVHEMVFDPQGRPIDYRFLAVNPAFEHMTGLEASAVTGRLVSEMIPELETDWIETYGQVVLSGIPARFERRVAPLDKWLEIYAFRPREGQFACILHDITERRLIQDALLFLVECGYRSSGESFFQSLARYLGESLDMDYVCIDRLLDDCLRAQTVVVYSRGEFLENVEYGLLDTPCGALIGKSVCCFPNDVRKLFPNNAVLQQLKAESYAGTTLRSCDGKPVGLIAVIGRKPLANPRFIESVLQLVAVRAAGELERNEAERALRESDERHRSILNASPDDITITDLEGCIRMASPKPLTSGGATAEEELVGRPLFDFLVPEDRPRAAANLAWMRQGVLNGPVEYRAVRADRSTYHVEVNAEIIRGMDGRPSSFLFVIRDVSERKRVEAALRASEDQYRALVQNLSAGVVVHGPDTRVLLANPRASELLGLPQGELLGSTSVRPAWAFVQENGTPLPLDRFPVNRVLTSGQPVKQALIGMVGPGRSEPNWGLCDAYPVLGEDGGITQVVVTFIDITERRQVEARLLHAQKMESVGRLAGGIAHDFNNLLTVINGYSLMMMERLSPSDPMRPDLDAILKAGERAATLTGKILAFSRKQMLQPRVFDLNQAVEELRPILGRMVGEDVEITVSLSPEPCCVNADSHHLEQVLMNLVVNARDAMPRGGKLLIRTSGVAWNAALARRFPEAVAGNYVVLTVSDDGQGMNAETRDHIFEPFFTTKPPGEGTGLGLSMVQGIVVQSGGFLSVQTELGHGSTFKIYLPRVQPSLVAEPPPARPRPNGGTESILLVEDQPEVRHFATHALRTFGYRVTSFADSSEALCAFASSPSYFDVLLTDVVMRGLSGPELVTEILTLRPDLKVLFMSGYTRDAVLRDGIEHEDVQFIQKPFGPDELAVRIRSLLDSE